MGERMINLWYFFQTKSVAFVRQLKKKNGNIGGQGYGESGVWFSFNLDLSTVVSQVPCFLDSLAQGCRSFWGRSYLRRFTQEGTLSHELED